MIFFWTVSNKFDSSLVSTASEFTNILKEKTNFSLESLNLVGVSNIVLSQTALTSTPLTLYSNLTQGKTIL